MTETKKTTLVEVEAAALRLLSRRDHGRGELAKKLRRRELPEALIEVVLDELEERGYLDDARFAEEQGAILARKCWGPRQIAHKLRARGIDETTVDEALAKIAGEQDWRDRARQRMHSRFGDASELDESEQQRAFRHLTYRGYSPGLVRGILFDES